jgi:hypothetical protein
VCFYVAAVDILDDMLAGVGWSMDEYCKWGEEDYYPPLPNGNRLFVYDIRTIAVRAGVAMGEEGDAVVSHIFFPSCIFSSCKNVYMYISNVFLDLSAATDTSVVSSLLFITDASFAGDSWERP